VVFPLTKNVLTSSRYFGPTIMKLCCMAKFCEIQSFGKHQQLKGPPSSCGMYVKQFISDKFQNSKIANKRIKCNSAPFPFPIYTPFANILLALSISDDFLWNDCFPNICICWNSVDEKAFFLGSAPHLVFCCKLFLISARLPAQHVFSTKKCTCNQK